MKFLVDKDRLKRQIEADPDDVSCEAGSMSTAVRASDEHPRRPNETRDEIELFLRDAFAAGCKAERERSLLRAMEYAAREAPKLRAAIGSPYEHIINYLNPEEALDDTLLRDIHLRLQIHGEKYPDRMVSVLHRNVVLYTIVAAIRASIGGPKP
jgi:hypothetical protein